jgi:hypothetical protein
MRIKLSRAVNLAVVLTLLLTSGVGAQSPRASTALSRTFRADSFWVHRWVRGGETEEELLIEPRGIAFARGVVTVLDLGTRELHALDAATGKTLFVKQAKGSGPGEFKRPAVLLQHADHFGVLDHETARLSVFTARGVLAWDAPVERAFDVEALCALPGARVLLKTSGFGQSLVQIDSTGRVLGRYAVPNANPNANPGATPSESAPSFTASAKLTGPILGDHCAIVPIFGANWYTIDARGSVTTHTYVEPGDAPVITVSTTVLEKDGRDEIRRATQTTNTSPIASAALHRGDTLIVIAGKSKRDAGRVLDYYVLPSGRYVYSRRLPMSYTSLTVAPNGVFFGTVIGPDWSAVTAFEPSRTAPARNREGSPRYVGKTPVRR